MGGGDLNLKKSWHPSTMKNMEKVWKAEQRHEQEKKKIAELQREIREEREREEIRKFAEDGGVIEKKDELKLDWMYKGPGGGVSREDYLLGRAIDKSFDLLQEAEKEAAQSSSAEGIPGRSGLLDDQVDVARKLQEDPLLLIKKKEMETRSQILNNPVKLKKLQKMLKEEKMKSGKKRKKKSKSKKKKRRNSSSSSTSDSDSGSEGKDLDQILAAKYSRLKGRLNSVDVSKLISDDEDQERKRKDKREASSSRIQESSSSSRQRYDDTKGHMKDYGLVKPPGYDRRPSSKPLPHSSDRSQKSSKPMSKPPSLPPQQRGQKRALTEEEVEKRRREMMDNARWRDEQRERNVRQHREEERKEKEAEKREYDTTFLRKQLSIAASVGTVEGRIKSNINNIQRSGRAMDMNFARR